MAEAKNKGKGEEGQYSENDVLSRIESILRFTTDELQNTEIRAQAFEKLSEFEAQLLYQQRNIKMCIRDRTGCAPKTL